MDDFKEKVNRDGYVILEDVLTAQECRAYRELLNQLYQKYESRHFRPGARSAHGLEQKVDEKIVHNLHNKDFAFIRLLDHPSVYPVFAYLLQDGSYLNSEPFIHQKSAGRSPLKGKKAQQFHIDSRFPGSPYALTVQVMWILDEFTPESGATRVVPGSHRSPNYPENGKDYPGAVTVRARPGSVLVFNGSLWHGSGEKRTEGDRWAVIYSYARWFVKPGFDFNRNMPRDYYHRLTDRQKELMGYKFNPSIDEFHRISMRSETFEEPSDYQLPQ